MKKLVRLDEKIEALTDEPLTQGNEMPTYRRLLKILASNSIAKTGEESLDMIQLGLKLRIDGDVDIEDAQFRILKAKVNENPLRWNAIFQGSLLMMLNEVEKQGDK